MQLFAPAKINLWLRVLGRRQDGFHEIETFMVPISLHDELTLEPTASPALEFSCDDPSLPGGENNLAVRAARRFFQEIKVEPAVRITLQKKIPHGAGLGGGSSNAATVLLGLNQLNGEPLQRVDLEKIAAEIGSDVSFFLHRSPAIARGRGEIIQRIATAPRLSLLLLKTQFGVPTPWAYQHWNSSRELPGVDYGAQTDGDLRLTNDLERPVYEKYVFLAEIKRWLRKQPEVSAALLSGSGSTLFGILRVPDEANELAARARRELDPAIWTCAAESLVEL